MSQGMQARLRKEIEAALLQFFKEHKHAFSAVSPLASSMYEDIRAFVLRGGKRIRPMLVMLAFHGYVKQATRQRTERARLHHAALQAAVGLELLHAFFLVHDDIMDQSELRRGGLTLHRVLGSKYSAGKDARFGESLAITAGDILHQLGMESLSTLEVDERCAKRVLGLVMETIRLTMLGQLKDVYFSNKSLLEVTKEQIMLTERIKTAHYTFEMPLLAGALLAGAPEQELATLRELALELGPVFQLRDDVLDLFGNEKKTGKPVMSDMRQGKKTLLLKLAAEYSGRADTGVVSSCLGKRTLSGKDILQLRAIIEKSGALNEVQKEIDRHMAQGKRLLLSLSMEKEVIDELLGLADYLARRKE